MALYIPQSGFTQSRSFSEATFRASAQIKEMTMRQLR